MKTIFKGIALAVACLAPAGAVYAAICTSTGSTAWGLASTWTSTGNCGHVPLAGLAGDDVVIASGHTVTVNGAAGCKSLSTSGNSSSGVVINAGQSLTVSGDAVLNATSINNNNSKTINVGAGTLTIGGNLTLTNGTGSRTAVLSMSTGTAYIGGSLSSGGTLTPGTGTMVYNGAGAQNVGGYTYNHLNLSGSGNKSAGAGLTVNGNLTIGAGTTFLASTFTHNIKGNLGNSGTLTRGSSTFIFDGASAQSLTGAATFNNLTMNNAAGLTLNNTVAVDGTLTLSSGNITTGANALVINPAGSVTRTSGHVVGNMTKHFVTGIDVMQNFEIGTGADYAPVEVTIAAVTTAGDMTATTATPDHPQVARASIDSTKSVNRYWTLGKDANLVFDALSAVFNFVSGDIDAGSNTDNFIVQRYVAPDWINTTLIAPLRTSTEAGNIIALGDFVVGQSIVGFSHEKEFVFIRELY